jgi:hypothetical protein
MWLRRPIQLLNRRKKGASKMLSPSRNGMPIRRRLAAGPPVAEGLPEARLLANLAGLEWLHSPSPIERLESAVGRERLSQLLLLVALCPEEEDRFASAVAAPQAA